VTPERKDPLVLKVPRASRASREFKVLRVLKVPKGLRALPVRRATKERRVKLRP
jgi:hypothetical protein